MNAILSLLLWNFAPQFLTPFFLSIFYVLQPTCRPTTPTQHFAHVKWGRTLLIGAYLILTLLPSLLFPPGPNYYQLLGLPTDRYVGQGEVRKAYRFAARTHHPDKGGDQHLWLEIGKGVSVLAGDVSNGYSGDNDLAPEGLRWGWERFGSSYVDRVFSAPPERRPVSRRDNFFRGLQSEVVGFYVVSGFFLWYFNRSAMPNAAALSWWRPVLFTLLFACEFSEIIHPLPSSNFNYQPSSYSGLLRLFLPLPFQRINFYRQLFIAINSAINQLGPVWLGVEEDGIGKVFQGIERLGQSTNMLKAHIQQRWQQDVGDVIGPINDEKLEKIKERTVQIVTDIRLRKDEDGNKVWIDAVQRKRREMSAAGMEEEVIQNDDPSTIKLDGALSSLDYASPPPLPSLITTPSPSIEKTDLTQ